MAAPTLLDEPHPNFVGNVRRELFVLGTRELVKEGELARAKEDFGDA